MGHERFARKFSSLQEKASWESIEVEACNYIYC
jgi:hypothetical protein